MSLCEDVNIDAVVKHALALETGTHTVLGHEIDGRLFQNSCPDTIDHIILGTIPMMTESIPAR